MLGVTVTELIGFVFKRTTKYSQFPDSESPRLPRAIVKPGLSLS